MKHFGMTVVAAGLALTAAYSFGAQSVGMAQAGSQSCTYKVETVVGRKTMHASLHVSLDAASPSGESTPDLHSFLRLNVSALDEGCEDVTVEEMLIDLSATDNAGSGWVRRAARLGVTLEDVATGEVVAEGVPARILGTTARFSVKSFTLTSGETKTLDVYLDASGASGDLDDMVQLEVASNGVTWSDDRRTVHEMSDAVTGSVVTF